MKLMRRVLALAALASAAVAAVAQANTYTIQPVGCGAVGYFRCVTLPFYGGGSAWVQFSPGYTHFIQFSIPADKDGDALVGTANNLQASTEIVKALPALDNAYVLHLLSYSFTDVNGEAHSGNGTIYYHYSYVRGSGKGGGGGGWHLEVTSGTLTVID